MGTYGVLYDNEISFVFEGNTELNQESVSGLAHNHGAEELATEPSSTTRRDRSLNDSDFEVGTCFAEHVCRRQTA